MAANEYKVKVGVEFNAQMSNINSQIDQLKDKITKLGSATGDKSLAAGLNKDIQEITNRLNGLRDMTITPANFNRFQAELQAVNGLIQKVQSSLNNIDVSNILQKIEEQKSKQTELNKEIEVQNKLIDDLNNTDNRTDEQNKQLDEAIQKRKQLTQQVNGHKGAQTKLEKQLAATGLTQEEITRLLEAYGRAMQEAEKDGQKFKQGQEELANSKLADTIQRQVNAYIGLGAIYRYTKSYIQDLVRTYKEFDQSLVAIAAVTGQTRDQMWANIGVYNKMAQSLGVTTQEVINASKLYYQQGLTTTSVLKLTEETVKLATIAELDSADATEYLTTAMNGFKLSAEESTRVTDVWANLAAKTASDVDELAIAISKVASLAENAGMEIETASAFLNQMIETTREAPENLGTALKTIIARFQELKTSEEELSDGVDANKVERALKSAGVALRDASGQFRDFDDVILELSSKWDGLDRNTQRYIATIAAGSRQQSRFIALVSDYDGLLRNVNYAYDSLGSADAQMAVFQEGLAASTNRLKAAWEGLYTSWSESATVISTLIDYMADFVSTLADLGAGWSALIAGFVLLSANILTNAAAMAVRSTAANGMAVANIKAASSAAIEAASTEYERKVIKKATAAMIGHTGAAIGNTKAMLANAAATAAAVLPYIALAAVLGTIIYLLARAATHEEREIKQLQKQATESKQLAAQEKDRASNLGVLRDELEAVHKAGGDDSEVRQKIIDQFGDEIKGVNNLNLSYRELINLLEEEQRVRNRKAAANYVSSWEDQAELDKAELKKQAREDVYNEQETVIEDGIVTGINFGGVFYKYDANLDGYFTDPGGENLNKALNKEVKKRQDLIDEAFNNDGWQAPKKERDFVAEQIASNLNIDDDEIKANITDIISALIDTFNTTVDQKTGEINFSELDFTDKLQESFSPEEISNIAALFNGSFDYLSSDLYQKIQNVFGENSSVTQEAKKIWNNIQTSIETGWIESGLDSSIREQIQGKFAPAVEDAFLKTYAQLANNPKLQNALLETILHIISSGDPQAITSAFMESLGNVDAAIEQYRAMLDAAGDAKANSSVDALNALGDSIGYVNATLQEGLAPQENYYKLASDLNSLFSEGYAWDDFYARIESLIPLWAELTGQTEDYVRAQVEAGITTDSTGKYILQQTEGLGALAEMAFVASNQTVEGKRAELESYAATMFAVADAIEAKADEAEANGETSVDIVGAMQGVSDATAELEAQEGNTGQEAIAMWKRVGSNINATPIKGTTAAFKDLQKYIHNVSSPAEARALASNIRQLGNNALNAAHRLSMTRASIGDYGKAAGNAAKGTNALKDALKDLKEQLNEAKKSAEAYMDAVIDKLEGERDAIEDAIEAEQDKLEKERDLLKIQLEAWRDYIQERNDQAQNELQLQADAADMYFNQEIAAIQAKIDALDDEAEAEDRILKLQKARDEYNRAQNSRTRLVLTKGAGWLFKTDQNEIANAQKTLRDVQREIQKAEYQDQVNQLQDQAAAWQEIADKIGESAAEAEKLAAALEQFRGAVESGDAYGDVNAFSQAVDNQQHLNDETTRLLEEAERWIEQAGWEYQDYLDDQARQGFLQEFQDGVVGEAQLQENVTQYLENLLTNQAFVEAQQAILDKIQKVIDFYNEQKALLGLTDAELKAAEEMRDAIEKSYDPTAENLGLGEDSKYFNANLLGLIEQIKKLAEQQAALEAQQKAASAAGGGSSGGNGSGGGGTTSTGYTPYSGGGGSTPYIAPLAGNQIISGKILQDSIQYGTYDSLARGALNSIRDSYVGVTNKTNSNSTIFNIGTVNTKATDAAGFAADLKRLNYVN